MNFSQIRNALQNRRCETIREYPPVRASVLIPLVERGGEPAVLFEVRNAGIPQGGEICFPGGHVEEGESPGEAAIRETAEELLLDRSQIEMAAPLHLLPGERGREIYSYLGILHDYAGTWAPEEVSRTFQIPLHWFLQHAPECYESKIVVSPGEDFPYELIPGGRDYPFASGRQRMYFYRTEEGVIWGLTAKLLYHFLNLLEEKPRQDALSSLTYPSGSAV